MRDLVCNVLSQPDHKIPSVGHFKNTAPSDTLVSLWKNMQQTDYFMDVFGACGGLTVEQKSAVQNGIFFPVSIMKKCPYNVLAPKGPPLTGSIIYRAVVPAHQSKVLSLFISLI